MRKGKPIEPIQEELKSLYSSITFKEVEANCGHTDPDGHYRQVLLNFEGTNYP